MSVKTGKPTRFRTLDVRQNNIQSDYEITGVVQNRRIFLPSESPTPSIADSGSMGIIAFLYSWKGMKAYIPPFSRIGKFLQMFRYLFKLKQSFDFIVYRFFTAG